MKLRVKFNLNNIRIQIRHFLNNHPFIKRHIIQLAIMLILLAGLIVTIILFHTVILGKDMTTTFISIDEREGNFRIAEDSYISLEYIPEKEDVITFFLIFENLNGSKNALFCIVYDGKMEKMKSRSVGVKDAWINEDKTDTTRYYVIDFHKDTTFIQTFSCNLFRDKTGEVRLKLRLSQYGGIFDRIVMNIKGLNNFNLEYLFPKPKEEYPHMVTYIYELKDKDFQNGIWLRGNSPYIERKLQETQFGFGVAIAILVSSIVALGVDVFKDIKL